MGINTRICVVMSIVFLGLALLFGFLRGKPQNGIQELNTMPNRISLNIKGRKM